MFKIEAVSYMVVKNAKEDIFNQFNHKAKEVIEHLKVV